MTREEKLYSMRMQDLVNVADKLGIKINTKAAKSKAIETILAAEEMNKQNKKEIAKEEEMCADGTSYAEIGKELATQAKEKAKLVPMPGTEDPDWGKKHVESFDKPQPKRGAKIEYNGKSQNICAWAKELGISANTLYGRIYKLGWPVEKAFTK